jgi:gas vesicle protein
MDKKTMKGVGVGLAVGALAGAVAGILFAPKSGKETRADIANYLEEMKDKIAAELDKAGDFTKDTYKAAVEKVVGTYEEGKKITAKQAQEIKEELDEGFDKVKKAAKK